MVSSPFQRRESQITPLCQAVIEALAPRREKVQTALVAHHHVDGRRDGQSFVVHRGDDGSMDLVGDEL